MMERILIQVTLGILLFFGSVISLKENDKNHICPSYEVMENFQMSKFSGLWHVIQNSQYDPLDYTRGNFSAPGPCYAFFYASNDGKYSMNMVNSLIPPETAHGPTHVFNYRGIYMNFTNVDMSTTGILNFNGSIIAFNDDVQQVQGEHVVLSTDYHNYALVLTCTTSDDDDIPLVTAAILHRENKPNWAQIENIRDNFLPSYTMVSGKDLRTVSHINCALPDASFKWPNFSTWTADRKRELMEWSGDVGMAFTHFG